MSGETVSYVLNRSGGTNLQNEAGYIYKRTRCQKDRSYWICMWRKRFTCPVTVVSSDITMKFPKTSGEHTHSNQLLERRVREIEEDKVKVAAVVFTMSPRTIMGEIAVNLEHSINGGTSFMRSRHNICQAVRRKRSSAKGFLPKPRSYDDLEVLPPLLTRTTDDQPFLVLNDTVVAGDTTLGSKRLLIFMSQHGKEVMATCSSWFVDGTFKAASNTLFTQIFFLLGLKEMGKAVPCLFGLLPNKE
jgi:hypothetical protein